MGKLLLLSVAGVLGAVALSGLASADSPGVPDMMGTWSGDNRTISAAEGYRVRKKSVNVTEQQGRRFKGTVDYADGTDRFIGILRSDNKSFMWVDIESQGHVFGEIVSPGVIEACYLHTGEDAVAGCSILVKQP